MKHILISFLFAFFISNAFATHIIGGEMRYEYIGPGAFPNTKQYRIHLLLLKDNNSGANLNTQYVVGVFNNDNNQKVLGPADNNNWWAV